MGGTGKSVVVMYLIKLLKKNHPVATLSRGYGRKTKGLVVGGTKENASTLGDEPYQFLQRYPETVVVVSEKRTFGMKTIENMAPPHKVILDDIMQHRWVRPKMMIMTSSFESPYFKDFVLPMGGLREFRSGVKRADILLITRSPEDLSQFQKEQYLKKIKINIPIFFTKISYADVLTQKNTSINSTALGEGFLLVTGIANPNHLVDHLKKTHNAFDHLNFKDHHDYSVSDCQMIQKRAGDKIILTTEKDYVKLAHILESKKLYCIKIELDFVFGGDRSQFDKMVKAV
jgi:tetraacyldisaccharide 4'-kinase